MTGYRVNDDELSYDARRMRLKRARYGGSLPTEKARNRAIALLIKKHRAEFDKLVHRERKRYE